MHCAKLRKYVRSSVQCFHFIFFKIHYYFYQNLLPDNIFEATSHSIDTIYINIYVYIQLSIAITLLLTKSCITISKIIFNIYMTSYLIFFTCLTDYILYIDISFDPLNVLRKCHVIFFIYRIKREKATKYN